MREQLLVLHYAHAESGEESVVLIQHDGSDPVGFVEHNLETWHEDYQEEGYTFQGWYALTLADHAQGRGSLNALPLDTLLGTLLVTE